MVTLQHSRLICMKNESITIHQLPLLQIQGCQISAQLKWLHLAASKQRPLDRQAADVVPGDLAATLENHRVSNREHVIRKHPAPKPESGTAIASDIRKRQHSLSRPSNKQSVRSTAQHRLVGKAARRGNDVYALGSYVLPLTYKSKSRLAPYLNDDDSKDLSGYQRLA